MPDLDTAIRNAIECSAWQIKGCDPDVFDAIHVDRLAGALLALVDEHEKRHRLLGEPYENHTGEGPLCKGWPVGNTLCRHLRIVAEKLGTEVTDA